MNLIEVKNLRQNLGKRPVIQGVDLHIAAGELVGLIGPNGAGKSTLLKSMARLLKKESGMIAIRGNAVESMSSEALARKIAYIPQGQVIHWPLSVENIVSLGRIPHLGPLKNPTADDYRAVENAMRETGISALAGRPADELAGGEKTLTMLARALAVEPDILLADEPVAGLDLNHQLQVMQLLKGWAEKSRGILIVLHDLTLATRFCDRLYFLHQGKILSEGKPEKVLSPENLRTGYDVEVRIQAYEGGFSIIPWKRKS